MEKRFGYITLYDLRRKIKEIITKKFKINFDDNVVLDSDLKERGLKTRYDKIYINKNFKLIEENFYNVKKFVMKIVKYYLYLHQVTKNS